MTATSVPHCALNDARTCSSQEEASVGNSRTQQSSPRKELLKEHRRAMRVFVAVATCLVGLYVLDVALFGGYHSRGAIEVAAQLRRAFGDSRARDSDWT